MRAILFPVEAFARYSFDLWTQFVAGMRLAGWTAAGWTFELPERNVLAAIEATNAEAVLLWPPRFWDWKLGRTELRPEHRITGWEGLVYARPDVLRVCVLHDAATGHGQQSAFHAAFRPHALVVWYQPASFCHLYPAIPHSRFIRTWHTVEPDDCPMIAWRDGVGVLSGALSRNIYPLRHRVKQGIDAGELRGVVDWLGHPGYGMIGPRTAGYLLDLSRYRVAVCTASKYGWALRKIIEATAVGCKVVTDLPAEEILPAIDGNLVRVSPHASVGGIRKAVVDAAESWRLDEQRAWAKAAQEFYDWRVQGALLAETLDSYRRRLLESGQLPVRKDK